jgi:hypothetical protein
MSRSHWVASTRGRVRSPRGSLSFVMRALDARVQSKRHALGRSAEILCLLADDVL